MKSWNARGRAHLDPIERKAAYEEAGRAHRYLLSWRHAAFAGYFAILYGVISLIDKLTSTPTLLALVLVVTSFVGVGLFFIDVRTRELYNRAVQAGRAIELGEKVDVFSRLAIPPSGWWPQGEAGPHSKAIWLTYGICSLVLLVAGIYVALLRFCAC